MLNQIILDDVEFDKLIISGLTRIDKPSLSQVRLDDIQLDKVDQSYVILGEI